MSWWPEVRRPGGQQRPLDPAGAPVRALVLTDFHQLDLVEVDRPEPGPGEVLLRICATGICGSDVHGFTGENGRRVPGQIMGHESSGTIAALGEGVDPAALPVGAPATFNPVVVPPAEAEEFRGREQHASGKLVIGVAQERPASFADYVLAPARNVLLVDPDLPLHLGALIEPLAVAVHAVGRGAPQAEEKVLVIGGGPIGQSILLYHVHLNVSYALLYSTHDAEQHISSDLRT